MPNMTDHEPLDTEQVPPPIGLDVTVHGWGFLSSGPGGPSGAYAQVTRELLERLLHGLRRWAE